MKYREGTCEGAAAVSPRIGVAAAYFYAEAAATDTGCDFGIWWEEPMDQQRDR